MNDSIEDLINKKDANRIIEVLNSKKPEERMEIIKKLIVFKEEWIIPILIQAMKFEEPSEMFSMIKNTMCEIGEPAKTLLIDALQHENIEIIYGALIILDEFDPDLNLIDALIRIITHKTKDYDEEEDYMNLRYQASGMLWDLGELAVDAIHEALEKENISGRSNLVWTLRLIQSQKSVPLLIKCLKDEDSFIREVSAEALGDIGDQRAVLPLIETLNDKKGTVRRDAAYALGRFNDDRAVKPLIQLLKDDWPDVRERAANALGWLKNKNAVKPLREVMKDKMNEREHLVKLWASFALANIGEEDSIEFLIQFTDNDDYEIRREAARALGQIENDKVVEPLISLLQDENKEVRKIAANFLDKMEHPKGIDHLIRTIKAEKKH